MKEIKVKILETKRLIIREFVPEDSERLYLYSREEIAKKELPDEVLENEVEAAEKIKIFKGKYPHNYPLVYAIASKEAGCLIGHICLSPIPEGIEVGYAIAIDYQGNGYATEVVRPFIEWGKKHQKLEKIYAIVKASNTASLRTVEKSGFTLESEGKRKCWGVLQTMRVYAL
jgi:[ribosomal protein S5]-alanine N-acetyltransferase